MKIFLYLLFFIHIIVKVENEFTPDVQHECNLNTMNALVSKIIEGIPSLGIESLDPTVLPNATFYSTETFTSTRLQLKNLLIFGFSKIQITSVKCSSNIKNNIVQLEGIIPDLQIKANYSANVFLLFIPVQSVGVAMIKLMNVSLTYRITYNFIKKNENTYLDVKNLTANTNVENGTIMYRPNTDTMASKLDIDFSKEYEENRKTLNNLFTKIVRPVILKFSNEVSLEDIQSDIVN